MSGDGRGGEDADGGTARHLPGEADLAREEAQDALRVAEEARDLAEDHHGAHHDDRHESHDPRFGRPGQPLRRDSPFMLGFLGALGVFLAWFLTQAIVEARGVILLIVVSLFLAVGLNPVVEWLVTRGLRRGAAIGAVFLAVIAAFVGFGFAVVPPVVEQTDEFVQELPAYLERGGWRTRPS
jgi:hypothetical protein